MTADRWNPKQYDVPEGTQGDTPAYTPDELAAMGAEADAFMAGTDGGEFKKALERDTLIVLRRLADLATGRKGNVEAQVTAIGKFIPIAEKILKALRAPDTKE